MAVCEICGNDYDKAFEIRAQDERHTFDSFECAIPGACADLRTLRLPRDRPRRRIGRPRLLLRALRRRGRRLGGARPRNGA
jgi:hypothetical protein